MSFNQFKVKPLQRLSSSFWNSLMDALNNLESKSSEEVLKRVKYEDLSNLAYNIIPDQADKRDLGSVDKPWNNVYARSGSFSESLTVQGKPVIKDGDPISISDISDTVKEKITESVDSSAVKSILEEINKKFDSLEGILQEIRSSIYEIGKLELLDSTTSPLGANEEWISAIDDKMITGRIIGYVYTDKPGTLYIEQSGDGSNWDISESYSVTGGSTVRFADEKVCQYTRVRYVNGDEDQTIFRLYIYRRLRLIT